MIISAPVSVGELLDKLSILYIKSNKITDEQKLQYVNQEMVQLQAIVKKYELDANPAYIHLMANLEAINADIWCLEDDIRELSAAADHGAAFVQVAKNIHITNDKRARIKAKINTTYNSSIVEVKSYK